MGEHHVGGARPAPPARSRRGAAATRATRRPSTRAISSGRVIDDPCAERAAGRGPGPARGRHGRRRRPSRGAPGRRSRCSAVLRAASNGFGPAIAHVKRDVAAAALAGLGTEAHAEDAGPRPPPGAAPGRGRCPPTRRCPPPIVPTRRSGVTSMAMPASARRRAPAPRHGDQGRRLPPQGGRQDRRQGVAEGRRSRLRGSGASASARIRSTASRTRSGVAGASRRGQCRWPATLATASESACRPAMPSISGGSPTAFER